MLPRVPLCGYEGVEEFIADSSPARNRLCERLCETRKAEAMIRSVSPSLDPIREKVEAGERLNAAEAESLWDESIDLHELGQLANLVRERKNGNRCYYNINTHLNPTNICIYR